MGNNKNFGIFIVLRNAYINSIWSNINGIYKRWDYTSHDRIFTYIGTGAILFDVVSDGAHDFDPSPKQVKSAARLSCCARRMLL